jgi:hypothetical protein
MMLATHLTVAGRQGFGLLYLDCTRSLYAGFSNRSTGNPFELLKKNLSTTLDIFSLLLVGIQKRGAYGAGQSTCFGERIRHRASSAMTAFTASRRASSNLVLQGMGTGSQPAEKTGFLMCRIGSGHYGGATGVVQALQAFQVGTVRAPRGVGKGTLGRRKGLILLARLGGV